MELRDALRMLRSETGLTQVEFASAVYVSFSTVNRWENKGMRPNKMQSKAILDLAKRHYVSAACLEVLTKCLLAPRVDDKQDKARIEKGAEQIKLEQRDLLTAEQFKKTMDNINMALVGQRFYNRDPASLEVFYCNDYFAKFLGYGTNEFEETIRNTPFFAIEPASRKELIKQFGNLLSHQIGLHDFSAVVKMIRKDGSTLWMEVKAASLTEYSYGQEVFTDCHDVTRRIEAERQYNEEVLLRDVSMQVMFSNVHCNLTENRVSRSYNLSALLGKECGSATYDQIIRLIADAVPDGAEKEKLLGMFNRTALLRAYDNGDTYGSVVLYNRYVKRWFRNEYLVVKDNASGHIHALLYIFDIQRQVLSEGMLGILFDKFFDFVGLIDVETETVEPYFYAAGVFRERSLGKRHYPTVCEEKFQRFGCGATLEAERVAVSLATIRAQLEKSGFYTVMLHLKGYDGQSIEKKITYTYLDGNRDTIIMSQSDLDKVLRFIQVYGELYHPLEKN